MKKKVLGYGYKLRSESITYAVKHFYPIDQLRTSKGKVKRDIKADVASGSLSARAKPQIFKLVIEVS